MKKFIPNPEYEKALYEISTVPKVPLFDAHRFNVIPPDAVWNDGEAMSEFLKVHSIPPYIKVEEATGEKCGEFSAEVKK